MSGIHNDYFSILPADCKLRIFSQAAEGAAAELGKTALVCKEWRLLQMEKENNTLLWEPVFNRCVADLTYDIDHASATTYEQKAKLINKTRLDDFIKAFKKCIILNKELDKKTRDFDLSESNHRYYLKEYDMTLLIQNLVGTRRIDCLSVAAQLILFRAKFNANAVAKSLYAEILNYIKTNHLFCLFLMIKLKHDLSQFFQEATEKNANTLLLKLFTYPLKTNSFNGIKMSDYLASGYSLNVEKLGLKFEPFPCILMSYFEDCYSTGQFQIPFYYYFENDAFVNDNEKLTKYIRKTPVSENDLKEFILDVLIHEEKNPMFYPAKGASPEGTALDRFRHMVFSSPIPRPNAFSEALAALDQLRDYR